MQSMHAGLNALKSVNVDWQKAKQCFIVMRTHLPVV